MNQSAFKFELGSQLAIAVSGETGIAVGRAQYANSENQYLMRYSAADGRAVEAWWGESALKAAA